MKVFKVKNIFVVVGMILIACSAMLFFSSCGFQLPRDNYEFVIENRTSGTLYLYIDDFVFDTPLQPDETINLRAARKYSWDFVAKNTQGEVVFSLVLKPDDIPDETTTYKIVIPPVNNVECSDNTTGK